MDTTGLPDTDALLAAGKAKPHGEVLVLRVEGSDMLEVEVFRSEAATVAVPECDATSTPGTQSYTTVQDVLAKMSIGIERGLGLMSSSSGLTGPSAAVLDKLRRFQAGEAPFTLRLHCPLGLSFISHPDVEAQAVTRTVAEADEWGLPVGTPPSRVPPLKGHGFEAADVAALLRASKRIVALTGAGVSTESGVLPFRSGAEIAMKSRKAVSKETLKQAVWTAFNPEEFSYQRFLVDPVARRAQWDVYTALYDNIKGAPPNGSHTSLAELHRAGKLHRIVTQNIDKLHQRAGVPESLVRELHGNCFGAKCLTCGRSQDREAIHTALAGGATENPACFACGGPVKVTTIAFGQPLPNDVITGAEMDFDACDLVVIMGTGLLVRPANELPLRALARGVPVVIVNLGDTPLDKHAHLVVREPCGTFMSQVMELLRGGALDARGVSSAARLRRTVYSAKHASSM